MELAPARIQDLAVEISIRAGTSVEARVDAAYAILTILQPLKKISDPEAEQDVYDAETFAGIIRDMAIADLVKLGVGSPKTSILTMQEWMELGVATDPA